MNTYELIPDVSHWQGLIDFKKMAARNIRHVIMKATQGVNFLDPAFHRNRQAAADAGLGWIPYHYYVPNLDPVQQAAWHLKNIPDWSQVADCPIADVEESTGIPSYYATKTLQYLVKIQQETGLRPTIYTRSSYWKLYLSSAVLWADSYRLMVAHYKDTIGPSVCAPWDPYNWYIHQFTDRFNGPKYGSTSLQIDMSVVNGEIIPMVSVHAMGFDDLSLMAMQGVPEIPSQAMLSDLWAEWRAQRRPNPRKD